MDGEGWPDRLRQLAAACAGVADTQDELAKAFRGMARQPGSPAELRPRADLADAAAYRMRTAQWVFGEQARAYEAMVAAGGRDNERAYAAFLESFELTGALLPTNFDSPDLDK